MTIEIRALKLAGAYEIRPSRLQDERGFFSETYNAAQMSDAGLGVAFVQDNHSYSVEAGVLRGLHFQLPPYAQDKLVRVARGRVYDVIVDIRKRSPTFGDWLGIELSAQDWNQLFVPKGFAHGFLTLETETEVLYKVSNYYNSELDRSIRYDDEQLAIGWPLLGHHPILSAKDENAPRLSEVDLPAVWDA